MSNRSREGSEGGPKRVDVGRISPIGFDGIATYVSANEERIKSDLGTYFGTLNDPARPGNTGRLFETFSALGKEWEFDANDVAACAALSVPFDGHVLDGLWSIVPELNLLLADCPSRSTTLAKIKVGGPQYQTLTRLYERIRSVDGMGMVRTSKLLASKRPNAVPIRDSFVDALLGAPSEWWPLWHRQLSNVDLVASVRRLASGLVPRGTSVLRIFDVFLWMEADRQARAVAEG